MRIHPDPARVAIITGASEGIGQSIARGLLEDRCRVILVSRNLDKLRKAINGFGPLGAQAHPFAADLTDAKQVTAMTQAVLWSDGRIDILVNNIGQGLRKQLVDTSDEEWDEQVRINLTSAFLVCRAVIPMMREHGKGLIVNIASRAGRRGEGDFAAYCAVKHGLIGLTRALADSEGPYGIRVNAICPGPIATEKMIQRYPDTPHDQWSTPDAVAGVVRFLASPAAAAMNGQVIDLF